MKQNVLRMLKCIDKNQKRIKMMVQIITQVANQAIGKQKCGRKRMKLTYAIAGMIYYMHSSISWEELPSDFGNYKTIYGWYRRLTKLTIFKDSFEKAVKELIKSKKLSLKCILIDGSLATIMSGGRLARRNPRNHNKNTINRMIAVNGKGIPLALQIEPGTAHDSQFLKPLLSKINDMYGLPKKFSVHADKGFDSIENRMAISNYQGQASIPVRNHGNAPDVHCPRLKDKIRWKVERSIAWFNGFRRLHVVFARCMDSLLQLYYLAALMIVSRKFNLKTLKYLNWNIL